MDDLSPKTFYIRSSSCVLLRERGGKGEIQGQGNHLLLSLDFICRQIQFCVTAGGSLGNQRINLIFSRVHT